MYYLKQVFIIAMILLSVGAVAQTECQEDIDEANKLYDEGVLREAEKIAKRAIETCDLNKTQENEMLKLLASIYYEMDELELGDEYVSEFLKKNPYYVVSKRNDPLQFRDAVNRLKSFPRLSVSLRAGEPIGLITTKKIFPLLDSADYTQAYTTRPIFQAAMEIRWNFNSFISFNAGGGIRIQNILHQVPVYNQLYFNYQEQCYNSNFPVSLNFTIPFGSKFSTELFIGGEFELFLRAKYSYFYTGNSDISDKLSFYLNKKKNNAVIKPDLRNQYRYAALGGMRFVYKIERFGLFADLRYVREFDLYNNPDKHFNDLDLFLSNNYTLADVMFENFDISLGVIYNFFYKVKSKY